MKILLINPGQKFRQENIWKNVMGCMPPIGLAQVAAFLEARGLSVRILDANAEFLSEAEIPVRIGAIAREHGAPEFIGITATTNTIVTGLQIAEACRKLYPAAPVVFGGVHATILPDEVLRHPAVDYVVRGEGEETVYKLITGQDKATIQGLSFKNGGVPVHNPALTVRQNIDELPCPSYHLLPMDRYHPSMGSYRRLPAVGMVTSRGCPGKCTFCYGHYFGDKVRFRSVDNILREIRLLQEKYGIREISFYDDTFTAMRKNLVDFCNRIVSEKIDLSWSCFSRVDFINAELLALMKKAGCHQICYGIESGNTQILENIKKNISLDAAKKAIDLTKKAGIEARATFMLGNPGETEETMRQTVEFAISLEPDIALFNITTPYPGTEMYDWAKKNGYLKPGDWSSYDLSRPVMELPTVKSEVIERYYASAFKSFYRRPKYLMKRLMGINSMEKLLMNLKAFHAILLR